MDLPRSRAGSAVSNSGSVNRFERPLPPIPGAGETSDPVNDRAASDMTRSHINSLSRGSVDVSGIYGDDTEEEGAELNMHGVDESLLDIYPTRSSSLSQRGLTRSPYLEGVSNDRPTSWLVADEHLSPRRLSQELPRSSQIAGRDTSSGQGPVSLREFLSDSGSMQTVVSSMDGEASSQGSAVNTPSRNSTGRHGDTEGSAARHRRNPSRSVPASNRTSARSSRTRVEDEDPGYDASSSSAGNSPLLSRSIPSQARPQVQALSQQREAPLEFALPRWQPDAEVTFCPICRTQFNWYFRKHHCRKCGRVVCGPCSPHEITIPYQYIVREHPVAPGSPITSDPRLHRTDTAGSLEVTTLGGGERVRLCNPCVPDPNTAPPVNSQQQAYQGRHSRSASSTGVPQSQNVPPGGEGLNEYIGRLGDQGQPSSSRRLQQPNRVSRGYPESQNQSRGTTFTDRGDRLLRPDDVQSRSRSSTVGSAREQTQSGYPSSSHPNTSLERSHSVRRHPQFRSLVPNVQSRQHPRMDTPPQPPPRRRLPEEDYCWICHRELQSRDVPDFQTLRDAHVQACVDAAMNGVSVPAPSPAPSSPQTSGPSQERPGLASSSSTPAPIPNTPEGRTAAREQAHAAVVLGQNRPSPGPRRFNGGTIFPYKASEKDMVEEAECTICLDDFEVGQEMGRLECFCRFHLRCVRDWYAKKPGSCPVHDHDKE